MSNGYNVVFTGQILDDFTSEQVRANFAGLFRLADPAVMDKIFSGKRVLLHKGLPEAEARDRCERLRAAGALCEVTPQAAAAPPQPASTARTDDAVAANTAVRQPGSSSATTATETTAAPSPAVAAPRRLELGGAASRLSHHQRDLQQRAIERSAAPEPRFQMKQDTAVAGLDPRLAPWDPHFFPQCARGLSWGGFFAPFLWGTFNGLRLSFLPALGVRFLHAWIPAWAWILFYLAFGTYYLVHGREMAWEHKSWRNADHFLRVQRNWAIGSLLIFLLSMYGLGHMAYRQHEAARFQAASTQYESELMAAQQIGDADQRAAATGKARETYLNAVRDPAVRSQLQRQFHEEDTEEASQDAESAANDAAPQDAAGNSNDSSPGSQ